MQTRTLSLRCVPAVQFSRGILVALALASALAPRPAAAQSFSWTGAGADGNWSDPANWGGSGPANAQAILNFAGATQLNNTNDFTASAGFQVFFNSGAGSFSLWGNGIAFYDYNSQPPKIENDSTAAQTVNFPITLGNNNGGGLQINPVNGNLTVTAPVNLNTFSLQIWGTNGNTLTFPVGAILSGTGSTVALNQNSRVVFQDAETYTGDTFVNAGTLQLSANNALASGFVRLGDTTGTAPATLQLDNGQALASGLNVRAGSSGLKTFGNSTNGSGPATYTGSVYLDANANAYANTNGSLALAGSTLDLKAQTLTLDGPGTNTISGNVINSTGTGSLVKTGTGTAILTGNNTYAGQTTVTAGTLQVGNGGTTGTLGAGIISNVANVGTVVFNRSDNITLNNQFITSSGGGTTLVQNGSGTLTLAGTADNVSCTPIVNAGTLVLGKTSSGSAHAVGGVGTINSGGTVKLGGTGGDQIWGGAGFVVNSGGTFDMAGLSESLGTLSGSGTVTNSVGTASFLTLGDNNYSSSTFNGTIKDGSLSGAKITLFKIGSGTLTLGGANAYSGGTYVSAGTLSVAADSNLGSGGLTLGAATLHATASLATSRAVTLTNASTLTVDSGSTLSLNSGLTSTAAAGLSLSLNGGGTLSLKANSAINNNSPLYVNNATLELDPGTGGTLSFANKLVLANSGGSTVTMNVRSGTANFTAADFFTMADGSATANSTLNLLGGTMNLNLGSGQRLLLGNQGVANLNISGGTLTVASAVGTIQLGGDTQYSGNNASGTLTLSGTGAVTFNGSNAFLLGQNSTGKTGATGRLNLFGGTLTTSRAVTGSSGSSYVVFSGGTLKAGNTSSGFLTSLTSALVSTNGAIIDDGGFAITIAQPLLHDSALSGVDGGLLKKGSSTLTLSGNNTYSGGTVLNGGTLTISSDNNLGAASGALTLGGGTLHTTASITTSRAIAVTSTSTLTMDASTALTLNNGFNNAAGSGTAGLTVNGGGTLNLKNNVTIANDNPFTANALTLNVDPGASGTFNTAGKFVLANASSSTVVMNLLSGAVNMSAPGEYFAMADSSTTANSTLNLPAGLLTINALGILFADQGTANVNISGGSLVVSATTGNIQLGGFSQFDANNATGILTLSGTGSMSVNGSGVFELGRNSSGKSGAKGIINLWGGALTSSRSITGGNQASFFNFSGGVLAAGANNGNFLTNLSAAFVSTNGAFIDSGAFAVTIAQNLLHDTNVVGLDGGLTKLGAGDLTLAGVGAYTGPTLVKAGRLFVNGFLGTGPVTVTNGAALLGAGTLNGLVTLQSGATLQPGSTASALSTLTVNSNVTLAGSTVMLLNRTNTQTASQLRATGTLALGGSLTVTNVGPAPQANDTFTLFSAPVLNGSFGNLALPPLGSGLAWDTSKLAVNGTLSVATVASVTVSPASTNAECGSTITLTATPGGTAPLVVQWFDNQTNAISSATNAVLTLTNVTSANAGNYSVLVTNSFGNAAALVTVSVADTTPPVITLAGANPLTVECHGPFTDPGAAALDACAGSVPVVVSGTVDPNTPATYTLTYTADDGSGNVTNATRTVIVTDTTAPVISWSFTNLTLSADANCQALMPDVTGTNYLLAADACSDTLTITQTPTNNAVLALGTNQIIIAVADSTGNTAYSTNIIVVADTTAPVLTLLGDNPVTNECHTPFLDPGVTAADTCSGVASLSTNNPVDVTTPGVYTISYLAQDGAGNAATNTRTVYVVDTTQPVVTLNGASSMTVECHGTFADPGATALDDCAGSLAVTVTGTVDPNTPATYTLTYTATDPSGNVGTATRTVIVVDTTAPAITWSFTNLTLSADANCQVLMPDVTGTNYVLAADACSDTLTITQTPTNNAALVLGTNEVVIAVADAAGNTAYSTNTIVVADTTAPVITLLGENPMTNECHAAFVDPGFTAVDNCSGVVNQSTNNPVDANTPGVYTLSYVAQDAAGNAITNTRTVFVVDTTAPAITQCVPDQTLTAGTAGQATLPDLTSQLQAADNCSAIVRVSQVPPAGTALPVGVTTVVFYVDDYNLNTNTCSAAVTVKAAQLVAPLITSQQLLDDGSFQVQFTGPSGQTYKLLATPDLSLPLTGWNVLTNGTFGTNAVSFSEPATAPARFYRVTSP